MSRNFRGHPSGALLNMNDAKVDVRLLSFVGHNDRDILPAFLAHYRKLGVTGFTLALHGQWPETALDWLTRQGDVAIWDLLGDRYEDSYRRSILNLMSASYRDRWVILADADEFLELPHASLTGTIRTLDVLGLDCLPAYLLQRLSRHGELPVLKPEQAMDHQFPSYNFSLCEDMGVPSPTWKTKYPLVRVTAGFHIDRGNHWPPNPMSLAETPIRGILHHFKWRAALREAFDIERGTTSNIEEMACYRRWLEAHDQRLPTVHAKPYRRDALIKRGLLVKPDRRHLLIGSIWRKLQHGASATNERKQRITRQIERLFDPNRVSITTSSLAGPSSTAEALIDPANLQLEPGRICLISFDLSPPLTSGGIGTAMHALVDILGRAGHEVHILFCPYDGPPKLWDLWYDYWQNRGAKLHYLPRMEGEQRHYLRQDDVLAKITGFLQDHQFDLVHAADAAGYACHFAILREAGLAFARTKFIVTAHGGIAWHRRGNQLAWTEDEAEASFAERQMLRLADVVCCPSHHMQSALLSSGQVAHERLIVVPNSVSSQTRSFGVGDRSLRTIDELVMMGRIEPRKGIDRFARAIRRLAASGQKNFKITLLGKAGVGVDLEEIRAMFGPMGRVARFITGYDHIEAVNYVKTHDCLVVIPSLRENLPYSLYECLENHVPVIASDVGGMPELVDQDDHQRILVAGDNDRLVDALKDALAHGMRPSKLAFEPSLVGLKLAALHAKLVDEARRPGNDRAYGQGRTEAVLGADAIIYGDGYHQTLPLTIERLGNDRANGNLGTLHLPLSLAAIAEVRVQPKLLATCTIQTSTTRDDGGHAHDDWAEQTNRLAAGLDQEWLYCCHAAILPHAQALPAMLRLMQRAEVDAVVVGYQVKSAGDAKPWDNGKNPMVMAAGGPAEQAPSRNLFGAGLFLIKRSWFVELGGFHPDLRSSMLAHWELLNRLTAAGGKVIGIPKALATSYGPSSNELSAPLKPGFADSLLQPWLQQTPQALQGFIRMATSTYKDERKGGNDKA